LLTLIVIVFLTEFLSVLWTIIFTVPDEIPVIIPFSSTLITVILSLYQLTLLIDVDGNVIIFNGTFSPI
jgi:hypothetical protein